MKKRLLFIFVIILILFAALLLKKCGPDIMRLGKPKRAAFLSPENLIPEKSFKKRAGQPQPAGTKDYDIFLVKTGASGETQWVKTFGTTGYDWAECVFQADDGAYILFGRTYSSADDTDDFYMMKIDARGNSLWSKIFAGSGDIAGDSVAQAVNGGFIIAGKVYSGGENDREVYLAQTDSEGNYKCVQNFGREFYEWGYCTMVEGDGSYIIVGQEETPGLNADFYLKKRSVDGKYDWVKSYGGPDYDWAYAIAAAGSGYALAGLTYSYGAGNDDMYVVRVDENGNGVWENTYGGAGYDEAFAIAPDLAGGFIIAGASSSAESKGHDALLLKIDAGGNSLGSYYFGRAGNEAFYSVSRTKDGGYIAAGATNSIWE